MGRWAGIPLGYSVVNVVSLRQRAQRIFMRSDRPRSRIVPAIAPATDVGRDVADTRMTFIAVVFSLVERCPARLDLIGVPVQCLYCFPVYRCYFPGRIHSDTSDFQWGCYTYLSILARSVYLCRILVLLYLIRNCSIWQTFHVSKTKLVVRR